MTVIYWQTMFVLFKNVDESFHLKEKKEDYVIFVEKYILSENF